MEKQPNRYQELNDEHQIAVDRMVNHLASMVAGGKDLAVWFDLSYSFQHERATSLTITEINAARTMKIDATGETSSNWHARN